MATTVGSSTAVRNVDVDVLIPTCDRPGAFIATLACLIGQQHAPARVIVSDQSDECPVRDIAEVRALTRVLQIRSSVVQLLTNVPRRGLAHQRQFLLDHARAPLALFLDDDVLTEPDLIERLVRAITRTGCGFVGSFVNAPSAVGASDGIDRCPDDLELEPWVGSVDPEHVAPGSPAWDRRRVHFAAYLDGLCRRHGLTRSREMLYRVAWVGGCVLFDTEKLRAAGGFSFWPELPADHVGEDALAQLRVMARFGGAGLAPSGAWHQEVPTTIPHRPFDAPHLLAIGGR